MNNKIRHIASSVAMVLCLLTASFVSTGCNDDGNQTISLEFGNIKTMILGRWYTSGGTYWEFFEKYYTRSDMGNRELRWYLTVDNYTDTPYFGGIYLDGTRYEIVSMGDGLWVIRDPKNGGTIEFTRDENGGTGNVNSDSGSSSLVKRIEQKENNTTVLSVDFEYSGQLVSKAVYTGSNEEIWPCSPEGYTVSYKVSNYVLKISSPDGEMSATLDPTYHVSKIEGYVFGHNEKGQCTSMRYVDLSPCIYTWENDCLTKASGNPGGNPYFPSFTQIENKANLNLNWMLNQQVFDEDQLGLTICGYISTKDKYLTTASWQFDSKERPVSVVYGNYTYYIYYY